jgi:hypothetical protein
VSASPDTSYRVGNTFRRQVQVAVVGGTVEISIGERLIRVHTIRHDRTREYAALANPGGGPIGSTLPNHLPKWNAGTGGNPEHRYRGLTVSQGTPVGRCPSTSKDDGSERGGCRHLRPRGHTGPRRLRAAGWPRVPAHKNSSTFLMFDRGVPYD